jgi:hypothetical protein
MHFCRCSDGTSVLCLCVRGQDHDEAMFDVPVGQEPTVEEEPS